MKGPAPVRVGAGQQPAAAAADRPAPAVRASAELSLWRLPFAIQFVLMFFVFDGVEKLWRLAAALTAAPAGLDRRYFIDACMPLILAVLFDLLLAVQIGLRTRAGRFWGIVYFVALTAVSIAVLIDNPQRWLDLGTTGRLREVASWTINTFLAACLFGRAGRETLVR